MSYTTDPDLVCNLTLAQDSYIFVNRSDKHFTLHTKSLHRFRNPTTGKQMKSFRTLSRYSITVKTPASMKGVPVVNFFSLAKSKQPGKAAKIINQANMNNVHFAAHEQQWLMYELKQLISKTNLKVDFPTIFKIATSDTKRNTTNIVYSHHLPKIIALVMFPLLTHIMSSKASKNLYFDRSINILGLSPQNYIPVLRARNFDDILKLYPLTDPALITYLKEKYDTCSLEYSDLFWLTVGHKVFTEQQIHQLMMLKSAHMDSYIRKYPKTVIGTLRSVLQKIKFEVLYKELEVFNASEEQFPHKTAISFELLQIWSKNHRTIKGTRKYLVGLDKEHVQNYLDAVTTKYDVPVEEKNDILLKRMNSLPIKTEPLRKFGVPSVYSSFIFEHKGTYNISYLKHKRWLYDLAIKHSASTLSEGKFTVNANENLVNFLEEVNAEILTHFTRQKRVPTHEETLQLLQLIVVINTSPYYPHLKGRLPYTVAKLMWKGFPPLLAFDLIANKVSYAELVSLYTVNDMFAMPASYLYDVYDVKQKVGEFIKSKANIVKICNPDYEPEDYTYEF